MNRKLCRTIACFAALLAIAAPAWAVEPGKPSRSAVGVTLLRAIIFAAARHRWTLRPDPLRPPIRHSGLKGTIPSMHKRFAVRDSHRLDRRQNNRLVNRTLASEGISALLTSFHERNHDADFFP